MTNLIIHDNRWKYYFPSFCFRDCISRSASSRVVGLAFFLISSHTFSGARPSKGLKIEEVCVFFCDMMFYVFQFQYFKVKNLQIHLVTMINHLYHQKLGIAQPYVYQLKVAELLLSGKNVFLSVYTGAGKHGLPSL